MTFSSGDVLTAADMNALPAGEVARQSSTSTVTLTTTIAVVNSVTFTAKSGRLYMAFSSWWTDSFSTTLYVRNLLFRDGTRFQEVDVYGSPTLDRVNMTCVGTFEGTGTTVTVTSQGATNTGTADALGASGRPALLVVMDIGAV